MSTPPPPDDASSGNNRVLKLPAGTTSQTVVPFTDLHGPQKVAADAAGSVYVTDWDHDRYRVVKLPPG